MITRQLQNPLKESYQQSKPQINLDITSLILLYNSLNQEQSINLTSLIDMTQDKYVQNDMIILWQCSIAQINTAILKPVNQEQRQTSKITQIPSMIYSQLSKSITYNLTQCSFQLLVKKQNERQKNTIEKQNQQSNNKFPVQHRYQIDDNKKSPHTIPKRYRSISSQYSPTNLQHYLNQKESNLRVNKKWLQDSPHKQSHSTQLRVQAQLNAQQVKQNFIDRCRTTTGSLANKHILMSSKFQNFQGLEYQ